MTKYCVVMAPSAQKDLKRLPRKIADRILEVATGLADNLRPHGSLKLQGGENKYRLRVGDYRVIYSIFDDIVTVLIVKVRHRKDAY